MTPISTRTLAHPWCAVILSGLDVFLAPEAQEQGDFRLRLQIVLGDIGVKGAP
jgi:hypothetical protein